MNPQRGRLGRSAGLAIVLLILFLSPDRTHGQAAGADAESNRFYVVVSRRLLTDVSENDAKAAVRAWAEAIARERKLRAEPESVVADGSPALALAWKSDRADVLALTTLEYLETGIAPRDAIFVAEMTGGNTKVEYLLLVHQDSGITDLAELAGRSLQIYENSRTSLALPWLDSMLLERGLPPTAAHFDRVIQEKKLSATVLPVFFHQKDACLITRRGYNVMCELNPQIGRQLKTLETSPALLPSFSAIRTSRNELMEGFDLEREIVQLHRSPAGRQILNIFQSDSMAIVPESDVDRAVEVLRQHQRLMAKWESSPARRKAIARQAAGAGRDAPTVASEGGGR